MTRPATRRRKPLYPVQFATALRKHIHLPVRSEKLQVNCDRTYLDFFVDNHQLDLIKNPDWQIIYGRRGTGKTLMLCVLREQAAKDFEQQRILSIYITAQDCLVSPIGRSVSDRLKALGYFQTFLELIADELINRVDLFLGKVQLIDRITGVRAKLRHKIEATAIEVLELSQVGLAVKAFNVRSEVNDIQTSSLTSIDATGKFKAKVSLNSLSSSKFTP